MHDVGTADVADVIGGQSVMYFSRFYSTAPQNQIWYYISTSLTITPALHGQTMSFTMGPSSVQVTSRWRLRNLARRMVTVNNWHLCAPSGSRRAGVSYRIRNQPMDELEACGA